VVTAAHVIHQGNFLNSTLGITGAMDGNFIATAGTWILSGNTDKELPDENDIALYEFSPEQKTRFPDDAFIRVADVAFPADLSHAYFIVCGFPSIWSTSLSPSDTTLLSKMLQYGTFAKQGSTSGLDGYNPGRHFLLEASHEMLLDKNGNGTSFRTRSGHSVQMPNALAGVSGCSVWMVGDLRDPIDEWSMKAARLVGIETGIYEKNQAIKATRWNGVTTLLHAAFPQIRSVLEMYAKQFDI
jgi:hypothetical protein